MTPRFTVGQSEVGLSAHHPVRLNDVSVTEVAAHDHAYSEVVFVWTGEGVHLTDADEYAFRSGDVFVIPSGACHAFRTCRGLTLTNMYYLNEWLLFDLPTLWNEAGLVPLFLASSLFAIDSALSPQVIRLEPQEQKAVRHEVGQLTAELSLAQPSGVFTRATLLKLFVMLAKAWRRDQNKPLELLNNREIWVLVSRVEQALIKGQKPDFRVISQEAGYSQDHLSRMFRKATGYSADQYFQHRRVQRACRLLLASNLSISAIAHELAYADASHLNRHFKSHRGVTPSAFKRTYR